MITYFVLKDDEGKTAGCVRLESGRARSSCPCTLLLENGMALALTADETPLPARPLGAAVLRGDALMAWGTPPGTKLTGAELLYGLRQGRRSGQGPIPEPTPKIEPEGEPVPEPTPKIEPEGEPVPEPTPEIEPEEEPVPERTSEIEPEPEPEPMPETALPPDIPAPDDSAAAAADFGQLVKHAGEVYDSILRPPLPTEETPSMEARQGEEPSGTEGATGGDWFSETERLLTRLRR